MADQSDKRLKRPARKPMTLGSGRNGGEGTAITQNSKQPLLGASVEERPSSRVSEEWNDSSNNWDNNLKRYGASTESQPIFQQSKDGYSPTKKSSSSSFSGTRKRLMLLISIILITGISFSFISPRFGNQGGQDYVTPRTHIDHQQLNTLPTSFDAGSMHPSETSSNDNNNNNNNNNDNNNNDDNNNNGDTTAAIDSQGWLGEDIGAAQAGIEGDGSFVDDSMHVADEHENEHALAIQEEKAKQQHAYDNNEDDDDDDLHIDDIYAQNGVDILHLDGASGKDWEGENVDGGALKHSENWDEGPTIENDDIDIELDPFTHEKMMEQERQKAILKQDAADAEAILADARGGAFGSRPREGEEAAQAAVAQVEEEWEEQVLRKAVVDNGAELDVDYSQEAQVNGDGNSYSKGGDDMLYILKKSRKDDADYDNTDYDAILGQQGKNSVLEKEEEEELKVGTAQDQKQEIVATEVTIAAIPTTEEVFGNNETKDASDSSSSVTNRKKGVSTVQSEAQPSGGEARARNGGIPGKKYPGGGVATTKKTSPPNDRDGGDENSTTIMMETSNTKTVPTKKKNVTEQQKKKEKKNNKGGSEGKTLKFDNKRILKSGRRKRILLQKQDPPPKGEGSQRRKRTPT